MALKKAFRVGKNYYYAVITNLHYAKNASNSVSGVEHLLQVALQVKNTADPDYLRLENEFVYSIPEIKIKKVPVVQKVPQIDPKTGEELKDKDGKTLTKRVTNGIKEVIDKDYQDPFAAENMNPDGMNIAKLAYQWLRENIEFFSDFEDVLEEGQ
jgi:hypothetical protein